MNPLELKRIWERYKANVCRLEDCPRHEFVRNGPTSDRWTCAVCGGEVDAHAQIWYENGLRDGKRNV